MLHSPAGSLERGLRRAAGCDSTTDAPAGRAPAGQTHPVSTDSDTKDLDQDGSFKRDDNYITHPHHRRRPRRLPGRAGPLPAGRRAGLPVGQPGDHRAPAARARGRAVDGHLRPDPRRAQLDLRPRPGRRDPVLGIERLQEAYFARDPDYSRGITVPAIVDIPTGQVVTNDFPQITLDLSTEWRAYHRDGAPDLYPEAPPGRDRRGRRARLPATSTTASTGAGSPRSQRAYEKAYAALFARLDWLERAAGAASATSSATRSPRPTSGCSPRWPASTPSTTATSSATGRSSAELPVLWAYARDLFQTPGFGDTTDFVQIKQHYYLVHTNMNPTGIVPAGPDLSRLARRRTAARSSAAGRSATARRPARRRRPRPSRPATARRRGRRATARGRGRRATARGSDTPGHGAGRRGGSAALGNRSRSTRFRTGPGVTFPPLCSAHSD